MVRFANNSSLIEMSEPIDLPNDFQHVADQLSEQSPDVRYQFRYALVLAMIDSLELAFRS